VPPLVGAFLASSPHLQTGPTVLTAYEDARQAILTFAGRSGTDDVAIICRNTTEAINHLAYRLRLQPADVVVTTVVEHHANLLPWARYARRRFVECRRTGRSPPMPS
jgi:selenocysteine lyase/cysteine desulfurase